LALAGALALVMSSAAFGAAPKLTVSVSGPASAAPGDSVGYRVTVRNRDRKTLKRVRLELLLSLDGKRDSEDVRLTKATLSKVKGRKSARRWLTGELPAGTPDRTQFVLACAAITRSGKTTRRCAQRPLALIAEDPGPGTGPTPTPAPSPSPSPTQTATPTPTATATASPTATPTATATATATATVTPTVTPGPGLEPPAPGPTDDPAVEPASLAPPLAASRPTSLLDGVSFLFTGPSAIQTGVDSDTIESRRLAVLHGVVNTRMQTPIGGVRVRVAGHPEYGRTATQADGGYELVVNGGGPLTLVFERAGYIPAQRQVQAPWQEHAEVDPLVLVPYADESTLIDADAATAIQVARAAPVSDDEGTRQATLLFEDGTTPTMHMPDGDEQELGDFRVRMTEFTLGDSGLDAMPGQLPPASAYTYALELSIDEAVEQGARSVTFDKPVVFYSDNFLEFPVGVHIPSGYYDRSAGRWVGSPDGRVIEVLSESGGAASVDVDGDGQPDSGSRLSELGIDAAELSALSDLYAAGAELWRAQVTHFTPWDFNPPLELPPGAVSPTEESPEGGPNDNGPCPPQYGSMLFCNSQVLGERLPIAGSPLSLFYRSDRVPGRVADSTLDISLTGAELPAGEFLKSVELEVDVAGRRFKQSFEDPLPNMRHRFSWDRTDGFGRRVQGAKDATVTIDYVYFPRYAWPSQWLESWGLPANGFPAAGGGSRRAFALSQQFETSVGSYDTTGFELGGWTLDAHHSYDPETRRLIMGDGEARQVDPSDVLVLEAYAGTLFGGIGGDGGPAREALLDGPNALALDAAGALFISDSNNQRIRRVDPDGTIDTIAGTGPYGFAGDGGPATAARLSSPRGLAIGPDGTLYITDTGANRIRHVKANGDIETVAGGGQPADGLGDGGAATSARLSLPSAVAVGPDGTLYIADTGHHRVRVVGVSGQITTLAGDGQAGRAGDGGRADFARLRSPRGLAIDADGNVIVADTGNGRVRRIAPDGHISRIAGGGSPADGVGDGGPATAAGLVSPVGLALTPDGRVLVVDSGHGLVRSIQQDGTIRSVAGGSPDGQTDGLPATGSTLGQPAGVAVAPDGTLYVTDSSTQVVSRVHQLLEGFGDTDLLIASEDGGRIFHFGPEGRHKRTLDALTGGIVHEFSYDSAGRLAAVGDPQGPLLTVERSPAGDPVALVARGGQSTEIGIDPNGYMDTVTNPAGEAVDVDHDAGGLLTQLTEPEGDVHLYTYDDVGRLIRDQGPGGLDKKLERTKIPNGQEVTATTGEDRVWTFRDEKLDNGDHRLTVTDPAGAQSVNLRRSDGSRHYTRPTGDELDIRTGPDPRFGMQAPVAFFEQQTSPGGRIRTTTRTRTVKMDDPGTLGRLEDVVDVNGRASTLTFTNESGSGGTVTIATPGGRESVTRLDDQGRVTETTPATGKHARRFTYDPRGRVTEVAEGSRRWTFTFDAFDRVATRTDALGHGMTYAYDAADRVTAITADSGREWTWSYDDDGNRSTATTPLGYLYSFTSTPDNLMDTMALPGLAAGAYDRSHSADRLLSSRTEPSGAVQTWTPDAAGRLSSIAVAETERVFGYKGATRMPETVTWNRDHDAVEQTLAMTFDGVLPQTSIATGAATGSFAYESDDDLQMSQWTIDAAGQGAAHALTRDDDRLLTSEGPWTIVRDADSGEPRSITDGASTLLEDHDGHGGLASRSLEYDGTERFRLEIDRNDAGQIAERRETVDGELHAFTYSYDDDGRLTGVAKDGAEVESYEYDLDGNRTSGGATFDAQDRIQELGPTAYAFDTDGFLAARGTEAFHYGRLGELLRADSGAYDVTYDYDALGRRVRRQSGPDSTQYLYGNPDDVFRVTATIDANGLLTTYFYDDEGALHGFERGGDRYAVGADQVGTPRVVTDSTGVVVKSVERDSWGRVLADSDPGFELALGFAGGIEDPDTGLVRFGLRDYDPAAGRWTARDPSFFAGSPFNLYSYAANDPVSLRDPTGLVCWGGFGYYGVGGGVEWCADETGMGGCAEYGAGVAAGIGLDLTARPEFSNTYFEEITGKLGETGGSVAYEWDDCGSWKASGEVGLGVVSLGLGGGSDDLQGSVGVGAGLELGFKVGEKACIRWDY
jgi:RHS repeat-associated protein